MKGRGRKRLMNARAPQQDSDALKPEVWQQELVDYPEKPLAELVVRNVLE